MLLQWLTLLMLQVASGIDFLVQSRYSWITDSCLVRFGSTITRSPDMKTGNADLKTASVEQADNLQK